LGDEGQERNDTENPPPPSSEIEAAIDVEVERASGGSSGATVEDEVRIAIDENVDNTVQAPIMPTTEESVTEDIPNSSGGNE
jgi:hypothetical protein